jgi:hypothetical protein
LAAHSPFEEEDKPLRVEAQYLVAQLRWPTVSDDEAVAMTMRNYPGLTEDEIRSWWRTGEFRRAVKEAREVAKGYAEEPDPMAASGDPYRLPPGRAFADPYAIPASEAFSSPVGARASFWDRWRR